MPVVTEMKVGRLDLPNVSYVFGHLFEDISWRERKKCYSTDLQRAVNKSYNVSPQITQKNAVDTMLVSIGQGNLGNPQPQLI